MGILYDHAKINGRTPFKLSFRIEAVVPVEVLNEIGRIKVKQLGIVTASTELNSLDGVKKKVAMRMATYK